MHVEEDFGKVKWPSAELVSAKSWLWVLKQGDKWPYPLPKINLQVQNMLQHIQSYTGMSYMGPNSFYEPLERLLLAMDTEANLSSIILILDCNRTFIFDTCNTLEGR